MDQLDCQTKLRTTFIRMENYCNLIKEVTPKASNQQIQLHQDLVHEVGTIQRYDEDIPHEPSKWFAKDITEFSELNTNFLAK